MCILDRKQGAWRCLFFSMPSKQGSVQGRFKLAHLRLSPGTIVKVHVRRFETPTSLSDGRPALAPSRVHIIQRAALFRSCALRAHPLPARSGPGLPWRDVTGALCHWSCIRGSQPLNIAIVTQVWARGHNQKKDTHTLDFDGTLTNELVAFKTCPPVIMIVREHTEVIHTLQKSLL